MNVVYIGVPNPIDVVIENYSCKDFTLATNSGKIEATGAACSYILYPEKPGETTISIFSRKNRKLLGTSVFRTKFPPPPIATVGNKHKGNISKTVLCEQIGIATYLPGFDFDCRIPVTGFAVSISRAGATIFTEKTIGNLFSKETIQAFNMSHVNDVISFSELTYKMANYVLDLESIDLKIIQ